MTEIAIDEFTSEWERWRVSRDAELHAPDGPAALVSTHWTDATERVDGLPGRWERRGDGVYLTLDPGALASVGGVAVSGEVLALAPDAIQGPRIHFETLTAHVIRRVGRTGVRIYDHSRADAIARITTFAPAREWVLAGTFTPFAQGPLQLPYAFALEPEPRPIPVAGVLRFELDGEVHELQPLPSGDQLFVVFADATTGTESDEIGRFLSIPAPNADGTVKLDFNRTYLRNCAFSDEMNCPLPPASNDLGIAVTAGEKQVIWR